jgi:hypothetical protein
MASRTLRALSLFAFALSLSAAAQATAPREQTGQFALYRGKPQIVSRVRLIDHNELDVVQFPRGSSSPITRYTKTENQPLHVVLIRDDFRSFSHVHASEAANGHFRVRVALDAGHRYYAFVGSKPQGYARQVFRFILQAGAPPHQLDTTFDAPTAHAIAGPYSVSLTSARVPANRAQEIYVRVVSRTGAPIQTQPFRGAAAHTVFVSPQTLQYVHVDASEHDRRIALRVPPLTRGAYRMWLEFDYGRSIFAAPFTLVAK